MVHFQLKNQFKTPLIGDLVKAQKGKESLEVIQRQDAKLRKNFKSGKKK